MDFLVNLFTTALLLLYQFLGQNIGLTIIVFTVLTRLATFPLTQQQIKSSKAMAEVQPKMKKLQEKYKNDREKLAAEQMRLYREHGVNPLMGCLPLLIQFPILIGLYGAIQRALATSPLQVLDLSHRILTPSLSHMLPLQQKFLWLNLGAPDPIYIMPILVVATTYLQSKLMTPTPTSTDPKDPSAAMARNMTLMMPLMIGLFSLQFPSGLSIYWVFSNLAGIAQYAMLGKIDIRNLIGRKPAPTMFDASDSDRKKLSASSDGDEDEAPVKKVDGASGASGARKKKAGTPASSRSSAARKAKASKAK